MSPRPFRLRKISKLPVISGFKPYGNIKNGGKTESVFLHLEEYEALRLCDYEMLNHPCGFETPHRFGCPCKDEICPECGNNMVRKGVPHIRNL